MRYRYDDQRGKRYKTVELIVEELPYAPVAPKPKPESLVGVRIGISEGGLQIKVKQVGGTWNRTRQVWELRYGKAVELGLVDRIVNEDRSISNSHSDLLVDTTVAIEFMLGASCCVDHLLDSLFHSQRGNVQPCPGER